MNFLPTLQDFIDSLRAKAAVFANKLRGAIRSKTIVINTVLLAALHLAPQWVGYLANELPTLQPMISNPLFTNVMQGVLIMNLLLRFHTKTPLEAK